MAADKAQLRNYTERSESSFRPSALTGFPVSSKRPHGGVAQLVERFGRIEEARGSIPLTSTQKRKIVRGPHGLRAMTFLMAIALVLGACGVSSENKAYSGLELDKPRPMPDPILIDTQGQRFAMRSDTQGVSGSSISDSHPAPIFVLFIWNNSAMSWLGPACPQTSKFYS